MGAALIVISDMTRDENTTSGFWFRFGVFVQLRLEKYFFCVCVCVLWDAVFALQKPWEFTHLVSNTGGGLLLRS